MYNFIVMSEKFTLKVSILKPNIPINHSLLYFLAGSAEDKAKLMFDMYDINGVKKLTREDFIHMIK